MRCLLFVPSPNSLTWHLPTSQWPGMDVTTRRETARGSHRSVLLHRALCQSAFPTRSSQIRGGLRDWILGHPLLVLLISPTCSMSQWKLKTKIWLGARCPYRCTSTPLTLSQNIPFGHIPITASACLLTILTTTLKSRLDQRAHRTTLAEREE